MHQTAGMLGSYVGAVGGIALLCLVIRFLTRRVLHGPTFVFVTVGIACVVAVILSGFGRANGATPDFGAGILHYGVGGVIVAILWLLVRRGRASRD